MIWNDMIYVMIWYMIWYGMIYMMYFILYDMLWYHTIDTIYVVWYVVIWYMIWYNVIIYLIIHVLDQFLYTCYLYKSYCLIFSGKFQMCTSQHNTGVATCVPDSYSVHSASSHSGLQSELWSYSNVSSRIGISLWTNFLVRHREFKVQKKETAGPSDRAVRDVCSRPLACWDGGFDTHRRHRYLSVVCCLVDDSATCWSLVQRSPIDCHVSDCNRESSIMRRLWPNGGFCVMVKTRRNIIVRRFLCLNIWIQRLTYAFLTSRIKPHSTL